MTDRADVKALQVLDPCVSSVCMCVDAAMQRSLVSEQVERNLAVGQAILCSETTQIMLQ